jgi:hypothetical protein
MSSLPEYINAIQTFTYDVERVRESLRELNGGEEPTDADVLELIETWAAEEFGWGEYVLMGPDGEELD